MVIIFQQKEKHLKLSPQNFTFVICFRFALGGINSPRLAESLRFGVLEVQEHLETYFDRKDHVSEVR